MNWFLFILGWNMSGSGQIACCLQMEFLSSGQVQPNVSRILIPVTKLPLATRNLKLVTRKQHLEMYVRFQILKQHIYSCQKFIIICSHIPSFFTSHIPTLIIHPFLVLHRKGFSIPWASNLPYDYLNIKYLILKHI